MKVIVVLQGDEKRLRLNEFEALLIPGDQLHVVEERLVEVRLIEKRPVVQR